MWEVRQGESRHDPLPRTTRLASAGAHLCPSVSLPKPLSSLQRKERKIHAEFRPFVVRILDSWLRSNKLLASNQLQKQRRHSCTQQPSLDITVDKNTFFPALNETVAIHIFAWLLSFLPILLGINRQLVR